MKVFFPLALLLTSSLAAAQNVDFAPVGAKWWINYIIEGPFSVPVDSFVIIEVTHEEMKAGELCRVITNLSGCGLPNPAHVFTRHDSVFFFSEVTGQFELLYDFTATAGSSWTVKGLANIGVDDLVVNITEVKDELMGGQAFKTWYMPFTEFWGDRILEKVGSLWYPGPTTPRDCFGDIEDFAPHRVRCYEEDGVEYLFSKFNCDWLGDISGVSKVAPAIAMTVSPNPASDVLRVSLPETAFTNDMVVAVFTPQGRKLFETRLQGVETSIDISAYPAGIYYVILQKEGNTAAVQKAVWR